MESTELEAEGEALRRTLERIDFLLKQGFISEEDAACRKQGAMDDFCLAPMIDRRRRLQTQADKVAFGAGKDDIDLADRGNIASMPSAADDGAGAGSGSCAGLLPAADSDSPTCSLNNGGITGGNSGINLLRGLPRARASGTGGCRNTDPDGKQCKRPRISPIMKEVSGEAERRRDSII